MALTVDGEWWFDKLRGVPHRYAEIVGPLQVRGENFMSLPEASYLAVLAYSPWWPHGRMAAFEFDRFAQALHRAELETQLRAMTLDCSWHPNAGVCTRLVGEPRPENPVWQEGPNAPRIGQPAYTVLSDLWPATALPVLVLARREEFVEDEPDTQTLRQFASQKTSTLRPQKPLTAEDILQWVRHERPEALGLPLPEVKLETQRDFEDQMMHQELRMPGSHSTVQGCLCKPTWQHCGSTMWGFLGESGEKCVTVHGCPQGVGLCETTWPCGKEHAAFDRCEPGKTVPAAPQQHVHSNEIDVQAGLALWLHDIFSRHPFETLEEDPTQVRRQVLVDFLQVLCTYFPDNLEGHVPKAVLRDGLRPDAGQGCRKSLCHLGGLIADEKWWRAHTEEVEVAMERRPPPPESTAGWQPWADSEARPEAPPLFQSPKRVRRVLWRLVEQEWKLCDRPWPQVGQIGFAECRGSGPARSGLACGIWQLLHSLSAAVASEHDCRFSRIRDPNKCVGPARNETEYEIRKLHRRKRKERAALQFHQAVKEKHNASLPMEIHLAEMNRRSTRCFKVKGKDRLLLDALSKNATMRLRLQHMGRGHDRPIVRCTLVDVDIGESEIFASNSSNASTASNATTSAFHMDDTLEVTLELEFASDWIRNDSGAVVNRLSSGPRDFEHLATWKLLTVEGVAVAGHDWRKMLRGAMVGSDIVLEGPVYCNRSDASELCDQPCAKFTYKRRMPDKDSFKSIEEMPGTLMELSTMECVGHNYDNRFLGIGKILPMVNLDRGHGLVGCQGAPEWTLFKQSFVRNMSFCNTWNHTDCVSVHKFVELPHAGWVSVYTEKEVHAEPVAPGVILSRIRRMIALFWRCVECRDNFLSIDFEEEKIKVPRDLVLWLWSAHNAITEQIFSAEGSAEDAEDHRKELADARRRGRAALWPPPRLCPRCWKINPHEDEESPLEAAFDEQEVYHFIVRHFYASHLKGPGQAVPQKEREDAGVQQAWGLRSVDAALESTAAGAPPAGHAALRISALASGASAAALAALWAVGAFLRPSSQRSGETLGLLPRPPEGLEGPASSLGPGSDAPALGLGPAGDFRYLRCG